MKWKNYWHWEEPSHKFHNDSNLPSRMSIQGPRSPLHLTQLPCQEKVNPPTRLSTGFYVIIRYGSGFKNANQSKARGACIERLQMMDISLGTKYMNTMDIGLNHVTKNWVGFIKIHLKHPQMDIIALLKGDQAFVMKMNGIERSISKARKGLKSTTNSWNPHLHLKGDTFRDNTTHDIFKEIVRAS